MRAYGYQKFGDPTVFEELNVDQPELTKPTSVIIKTLAVGINNFDRSQREGAMGGGNFPLIPGKDVVGTVVDAGEDVSDVQVGDIVIANSAKTYAEYERVSDTKLVLKPENVSIDDAATIITPGITAFNAVTVFTQVKKGDFVLINGATGGVGSIAAQVAKKLGAYVVGIGSAQNEGTLQDLNIDEIGFYDVENINQRFANQADIVINAAMNGNNDTLIRDVTKDGGQAATVGGEGDLGGKNIAVEHIRPLDAEHTKTALAALAAMLSEGTLSVEVYKTLPLTLEGVIEGHELLETHHAPGRIILLSE